MQGKGPLKLQKGRLISHCGQIRAFETLHCIKYTVQGALGHKDFPIRTLYPVTSFFFRLEAPNFTLFVLKMCFIISRKLRRLLLFLSLAMSVQASFKKLQKYYRMVGRKGLHRGDSCQPLDYRQSPRN